MVKVEAIMNSWSDSGLNDKKWNIKNAIYEQN